MRGPSKDERDGKAEEPTEPSSTPTKSHPRINFVTSPKGGGIILAVGQPPRKRSEPSESPASASTVEAIRVNPGQPRPQERGPGPTQFAGKALKGTLAMRKIPPKRTR
jgi:hypothetical protein